MTTDPTPPAQPLKWTAAPSGRMWTAIGTDDTRWDIVHFGAMDRYGVIVAQVDVPDWWAATLEDAKAIVERFDKDPEETWPEPNGPFLDY